MDPKELKRIFQRGKCLSLETMRMYNEGKLPSKSTHEVEKHLLECSLCASAIDGLNARRINDVTKVSSNINRRLAVYMNTPPTTPILSRFGVAMIVSSIVVAIGLTIWFVSANTSEPEIKQKDTGAVSQYQPPIEDHSENVIQNQTAERPQNNGAVIVPENSGETKTEAASLSNANLPASLPGQENSLNVNPVTEEKTNENVDPGPGDNTRASSSEQFLRIKSVVIYPPTTHSDKKPKQSDKDGQLTRTSSGKSDFQLDEMPQYPGGNEALKNFILSNFHPQKENKSGLKRKSTGVSFQVNSKTGEVTGIQLSFPVSAQTDAELTRVISAMPDWNPGKKRGTVDVMIGVTFE